MRTEPFIDFQGKRVIVTEASFGIGRAVCVELGRLGAELVLMGKDEERLRETVELLGTAESHIIPLDLMDYPAMVSKVRQFSQEVGKIYGLCHSPGIEETRPLSSYGADSLASILNANLIGAIELSRAVCRRDVMEADGGSILFMSSIAAIVGIPGRVGYSASKGGILAAARSMAIELARRNIRVNTITLGLVRTSIAEGAFSRLTERQLNRIKALHPLGIGKAQDVARAVAFLLAPQNGWITGTDFVIDGGYTAR